MARLSSTGYVLPKTVEHSANHSTTYDGKVTTPPALTTTSYAVLGLLGLGPATPYELAKQVRRSLRFFWSRAERKIYDEPRRLVMAGYATAAQETFGRRTRTVYAITDAGRGALASWLREPARGPAIEVEAVVKVFFAEQGGKEALLGTLEGVCQVAAQQRRELAELALSAVGPQARYPQRAHVNALAMEFAVRQADLLHDWATWATEEVNGWDDTASASESWRAEAMAVFDTAMRILR